MRGGEGEGQSSQEGEKIVVSGEYVAAGGGGYIVRLPEQHWHNSLHPFSLLLALSSCRSQFRRQKRWWSAYLLFYERKDFGDSPDIHNGSEGCVLCDHVYMSCACHVLVV